MRRNTAFVQPLVTVQCNAKYQHLVFHGFASLISLYNYRCRLALEALQETIQLRHQVKCQFQSDVMKLSMRFGNFYCIALQIAKEQSKNQAFIPQQ
jgi:hypothetical protein